VALWTCISSLWLSVDLYQQINHEVNFLEELYRNLPYFSNPCSVAVEY
jgi:hypothetical protein